MKKYFPILFVILAVIGLLASAVLMYDTVELAKNPEAELPCNINPFISCKSVATTWQAEVFGFPNPIIGMVTFGFLLAVGLALVAKSHLSKKFMLFVNLILLGSMLFVVWFAYQSIYQIGSLCIYCMAVWMVTWPLLLYTIIWNIKENYLSLNNFGNFIQKNHLYFLMSWYVLTTLLIILQFRDFFLA